MYASFVFTIIYCFIASEYLLSLQGGRFDHPNRLFHSVAQTWNNVLVDNVDLKEVGLSNIISNYMHIRNNFSVVTTLTYTAFNMQLMISSPNTVRIYFTINPLTSRWVAMSLQIFYVVMSLNLQEIHTLCITGLKCIVFTIVNLVYLYHTVFL